MIYNLVHRSFHICSDWIQTHAELTFFKGTFCKNGYPNLLTCFKKYFNNIYLVKENELTLEKKHLLLDFPYLEIIYLQTRTKPQ